MDEALRTAGFEHPLSPSDHAALLSMLMRAKAMAILALPKDAIGVLVEEMDRIAASPWACTAIHAVGPQSFARTVCVRLAAHFSDAALPSLSQDLEMIETDAETLNQARRAALTLLRRFEVQS